MDLLSLQNQLKVAIQNHQITVAKMKGEPQNSSLQKQLHDLQAEIMSLSEKQKQVVQQLRKELEKKQAAVSVASPAGGEVGSPQPITTSSLAPKLLLSAAAQSALQLHRPTLSVPPLGTSNKTLATAASVAATFASSPAAQHIIRQVVPSLVNNLVAAATGNAAFKTPIAAAVLLPSGTSNAVFSANCAKGAENKTPLSQCQSPVLVVPSPAPRTSDASPSFLLNLAPPIRVPQYPPPSNKTPVTSQNSPPVASSPVSSTGSSTVDVKEKRPVPTHNCINNNTKVASPTVSRATAKPKQEEEQKMNFFGSLGLVNKMTLSELQSKRVERKRRTTANPHFSNAAVEERRKHAALLQQQASNNNNRFHGPFKRPRGRPRISLTPGNSSPESVGSRSPRDTPPSAEPSSPAPPPPVSVPSLLSTLVISAPPTTINLLPLSTITPPVRTTIKGTLSPINCQTVLTLSGLPQVLNGCLKPLAIRNGVSGEQGCCVCGLLVMMRLPTDGASCRQCKALAHIHCAHPGSKSTQQFMGKPWTCRKCRSDVLIAKEDQQQQLLKRRQELTTEHGRLKEKLKQLGQVAMSQQKRHKELMSNQHRTQIDVKRILDTVRMVQNSAQNSDSNS